MLTIPFNSTLDSFNQQMDLDGQTYIFTFSWNNRDTAWYMSITTLEEEQIADGIKLVLGVELLQVTGLPGIPPGEIWAINLSPLERIGRNDIGVIVDLIYVPAAEV